LRSESLKRCIPTIYLGISNEDRIYGALNFGCILPGVVRRPKGPGDGEDISLKYGGLIPITFLVAQVDMRHAAVHGDDGSTGGVLAGVIL
jgi:hypothetical protein